MVSQQIDRTLSGEDVAFLHRMDSVEGDVIVALTDRLRLSRASFLDGREVFWRDQYLRPLDLSARGAPKVTRFVFHVGFAGSTLLARLLDRPGRVITLKEPQCLADIAGQREAIEAGKAIAPLGSLLDFALSALGDVGTADVPVVVKPTNWVNLLLPELCAAGRINYAVFVSMKRRHYLGATFRGGNERLAFCARLAAQTAPVVPGGTALLQAAMETTIDPFLRMARIMALLHWLQEWLFDDAIARNGWPEAVRIDFDDIVGHPETALQRAQELLALPVLARESERAAMLMARHTKDPSSASDQPSARGKTGSSKTVTAGASTRHSIGWRRGSAARPRRITGPGNNRS